MISVYSILGAAGARGCAPNICFIVYVFILFSVMSSWHLHTTQAVESTEAVSQILPGRTFSRWAPSPFGVTESFT